MNASEILKSYGRLFKGSKLQEKDSFPLKVLILSPHPDDECINGGPALRLKLENKATIYNVAVTLGSDEAKRPQRKKELTRSCKLLGIKNTILSEKWSQKEKELKEILRKINPHLIIAPHSQDAHPTHIQTSELLKKVITRHKGPALVAWSEFWGQMRRPNVLIEIPSEVLKLQLEALMEHQGEIQRNPYHLRLPAWMIDNVRRGSEVISGKGSPSAEMAYGVILKLELWHQYKFKTFKLKDHLLCASDNLGKFFQTILDAASLSKTKVKSK